MERGEELHIRKLVPRDYQFYLQRKIPRNNKNLQYSLGVFKGDKMIAHVLLKGPKKLMEVVEFQSNSITATYLLISRITQEHPSRKLYVSQQNKEIWKQLNYIPIVFDDFICEYEQEKEGTMITLPRNPKPKTVLLSALSFLHEQYDWNIILKNFFYFLLSKFEGADVFKEKHRLLSILHRRNISSLDRINPKFTVLTQRKYPFIHKNFTNKLEAAGYVKIDDTIHTAIHSEEISLYDYPKWYKEDTEFHTTFTGQLFDLPSTYDIRTLSVYRSQFNFIKKRYKDSDQRYNWYLLSREGYVSKLTNRLFSDNIYHLIPRNFSTVASSIEKKYSFVERCSKYVDVDVKEVYESNVNTQMADLYEEYDDFDQEEELLRFIFFIHKLSRLVGEEKAYAFFKKCVDTGTYIAEMSILKKPFLPTYFTKKAFAVFLEKYTFEERKQVVHALNRFVIVCPKFHIARKSVSTFIKKEHKDCQHLGDVFLETYYLSELEELGLDKKVSLALQDFFRSMKKNSIDENTGVESIWVVDQLLKNGDKMKVSTVKLMQKHMDFSLISKGMSFRNYYIPILFDLANGYPKLVKPFAKKWNEEIKRGEDMYLHDSGVILERSIHSEISLSYEVKEKLYLHSTWEFTKEALDILNLYLHDNKQWSHDLHVIWEESLLEGKSLKHMRSQLDLFTSNAVFKKYKVKNPEALLEESSLFLKRMQRYNNSIAITHLFSYFKGKALDIIRGEYKGIFTPKDYPLRQTELADYVRRALGTRETPGEVSKPRKLYTLLSSLQPVSEILAGDIEEHHVKTISKWLIERKMKLPIYLPEAGTIFGRIEPKCSPEFLVAGDASVCCMSFGDEKAVEYALEKGFGIYNIYYKGRVVANSLIWINDLHKSLVIDNIEVHPNYSYLKKTIKSLYQNMIEDLLERNGLEFAVQGSTYNDLIISEGKIYKHEYNGREISTKHFYTDADKVRIIPVENIDMKVADKLLNKVAN